MTEEKDKSADDLIKALSARLASYMANRERHINAHKASIAQEQPPLGTSRVAKSGEPPVVPVRRIIAPQAAPMKIEMLDECGSCGYMSKSDAPCPRCAQANGEEAGPFWNR